MTGAVARRGEGRERILAVATEMIAAHGVDGVSIRSINAAAGVSPATLHYHFGSLDNLVEAILETEMTPLMERRMEMLETARNSGISLTARVICEILTLPLANRIIEDEINGLRYVRFLARLYNDDHPSLYTIGNRYFSGRQQPLEELVYRALPHLPRDVVGLRMTSLTYAMVNTLADLKKGPRPPYAGKHPANGVSRKLLWQRVRTLIDFLTGALEAPVSPPAFECPEQTPDRTRRSRAP
ncbi:MAG: TetR/AcrR family transcriptional regulator [Proteobacteria bacterium]|nr:TetR/AcrR family transcriptional regulator [Pseudomonadota bacterium]HQR03143.1 TetR/AcrR family transcriptional regulator [Rhodocyclaceae bacterium]